MQFQNRGLLRKECGGKKRMFFKITLHMLSRAVVHTFLSIKKMSVISLVSQNIVDTCKKLRVWYQNLINWVEVA